MQIELIEIILAKTHIYSSFWYFSQFNINRIGWSRRTTYWLIKIILRTCLAHLIVIPVRSFKKIVECSADITVSHIQVCGNTQEKLCVHACYLFVIFPSKNSKVKPRRPLLFIENSKYHLGANESKFNTNGKLQNLAIVNYDFWFYNAFLNSSLSCKC